MTDQLAILQQLEQLRSLKSQQAAARLHAEENELRGQIATLNEHRRLSHSTDTALVPMRAIGADVLWQAWLDRTQYQLNIDLARVLARKESVMKKVRVDLGRHEAVSGLKSDADEARRKAREDRQLAQALAYGSSLAALRSGRE